MATDREGKPMIESRSDDRDHDEDPDDDDLWYGSCRSVLGIVLTLSMLFGRYQRSLKRLKDAKSIQW